MIKLRLVPTLALSAALLWPATTALAQGETPSPPSPTANTEVEDPRLVELEALVPESFAGLPLREDMQSAPGELLAERMADDERAVFESMLAANGKSLADYAAANVPLRISDENVIIIQPHRVTGIDAAATLDTWVEILGLNAERPAIEQTLVAGREVMIVSDDARPDFPLLHLFAAGDVVWMVAAEDAAVVEEAVRSLALAPESAETTE